MTAPGGERGEGGGGGRRGAPRAGGALPGSLLFLCGHNAIRSPMAEALAIAHLPRTVLVRSAGLVRGERDGFVDAVIAERGLPLPGHDPRALDEMDDDLVDLVVTLSDAAHERAMEWARTAPVEVEHWPTADPSLAGGKREQRLDAYREVRDALERRIAERFGAP